MSDSILAPGPRLEPIRSPTGQPVPVTLLTGFLGAGKTTLLNRILNGDHGLKVGVLVNDFGAVNIDAALVEGVEENTIALSNGCVCCEVRDDLVTSLEELLASNLDVEYVVIEASGIADPEGVVLTLADRKLEQLLRLDSVTCVVDADALFSDGEDADVAMLKLRQIGFADLVVLNKVDLVGEQAIEVIRDWIGRILSRVRIVEAEHAAVPSQVLLSVGRFDPSNLDVAEGGHEHGPGFDTFHYRTRAPLDVAKLQKAIRALPASVYRIKGIVQAGDRPDQRTLLQAVGRRINVSLLGPWNGSPPQTDIVVIGADGAIDADELQAIFDGAASA